jgi:hypothetical protein
MKIRKRHQPTVFGSLSEQFPSQSPSPETPEAWPEDTIPPPREDYGPDPMAVEITTSETFTPGAAVARRTRQEPVRVSEADYAPALDADEDLPPAWPIYFTAFVVSVLWVCGPIAFAIGYRGNVAPFRDDLFAMAVFALLAVGPAAFVWLAAYMARQGQKLGAEARRAKTLADDLTTPVLAAAGRTGDVVQVIREEIVRASEAAEEARDTLLALREALAMETERLSDAAAGSVRSAQSLATTLGLERTEMDALSQSLDQQAMRVSDAITQQARMVAEASDLAQTQLREAEASLTARAADLAAAAAEATGAARTAGEDLNRHVVRLETAGLGVAEQVKSLEDGLGAHRTALVGLADALKTDHQGFAAEAEAHATQLNEFISQARLSAAEMGDRALKSGESLRAMVSEAAEQFRELAQTSEAERAQFGEVTTQALSQVSDVAAAERQRLEEQTKGAVESLTKAAEETRAAAAAHADAARQHVDQLSEVAFSAGQKASQAYEARLDEAKRLIEQSAEMIDQAGAATAKRLEDGASAARDALEEMQRMLAEVEARTQALPEAARGQAEQVRAAVSGSMDELVQQARRAAAETQAIDEAFQGRVRRNYEMLSEAVRLMGTVALAGGLQPAAQPPPVAERGGLGAPAPEPGWREEEAARPAPTPPVAIPAQAVAPIEPERPEADDRPRLRLTPTSTDEEFASIFEAGGVGKLTDESDGEGWTWKDLLSSIDEAESGDPGKIEQSLLREIGEMGIDPSVLFPAGKIDEIAAVLQARDLEGARTVVRDLAPAANRRVARKLYTDEKLKRQALSFVTRYRDEVAEAAQATRAGEELAALLNTETGRAYLLLEAAAGDLT